MFDKANYSTGFVYLLEFTRPISPTHTTRHYLGWTNDLAARIQAHRLGHGSRLCQVANERGIGFKVIRVWRGDRALERRLKKWKCGTRLAAHQCSPANVIELSPAEIETELMAF